MNNNNAYTSAFGNPGGGMNFGLGGGGGAGSAFGASGNTPNSAFANSNSHSNLNPGQSAFNLNSNSNNPNSAFNTNTSKFNINNNTTAFDASGNTSNNSQRGGGRGRGSSYRGGRGGSNRGSSNMTYVAPGLSTGSHHSNQQTPSNSAFPSGAPGDSGSAFATTTQGSNRGRGGGHPRGGGGGSGRGGRGGGVPGQFKSLQWRPEGAQNQRSDQSMDSNMIPDNSMISAFNGGSSGFQQQHARSQNNTGFSINTKSAFGGGGGPTAALGARTTGGASQSAFGGSTASAFGDATQSAFGGATQSAFGNTSLSSASSSAGRGFPNPAKQDSIFAVPASRQTPPSNNNALRSGAASVSGLSSSSFPSNQRSESQAVKQQRGSNSIISNNNNPPEDADSRLARFTAVPIGNRYEELKVLRVKERENEIRKGTIADPEKRVRLEDAIAFVGTCTDMCPEFERHEREYQQNIPNTEHIDHSRAVKAYARSAAGAEQPLPSDVRPPKILLSTLDYLLTEIMNDDDLSDSHAFIRDRTRSIRTDFMVQNSRGIEAVQAHEIIARYHILCSHQLCENENFSNQQEMEQLVKVLTSLQEFYDDMRREGITCPNEAEFRAYHILCHLRDPDMLRQAQILPPHIFMDPYVQAATEIHALTRKNNDIRRRAVIQSEASPNFFSRFFKLIQGPKVSYLMACLMESYFTDIRKGALKALNKSYLDQHGGFLVHDLVNILGFDDEKECIANCEEYDLALTHYGHSAVVFGRKDEATRRRIFKEGTRPLRQHRNVRIVEAKRQNYTMAQVVYGEIPGPHQINALAGGSRPMAPPISSRPRITQQPQTTGPASVSKPTRFGPPVAAAAVAAGVPALGSVASTISSRPAVAFDFGLNKPPGQTAPTPVPSISNQVQGLTAPSSSQSRTILGSTTSQPGLSVSKPAQVGGFTVPSSISPASNDFKPTVPGGFSFNAPQSGISTSGSVNATRSVPVPSQPSFSFKGLEGAAAIPFAIGAASQAPVTTSPFTAPAPISQSVSPTPPPSRPSITTGITSPTSRFSTPPPPSPVSAPPMSDATRIVTKRGRIYPRSVIENYMKEFLERETNRVIRTTVAQASQEVVVERSVRRAKERQATIRNQSDLILTNVIAQVTEEITEEILADLYRETKLKKKVIIQWREFTRNCRKRAEELKRRQEHFLNNVRAMGSRAGLTDGSPMAAKIREYNAKQQRIRTSSSSSSLGTKYQSSLDLISNKRKRLLSIGQEGSPDLALVAGLKKVVEPKREMWAPLPVLKIVESRYHSAERNRLDHQKQEMSLANNNGLALTKRRWRLFVNTPTFKETHSKWLLTKLGVDMGRHTRSQQRSGTMIAVHQSKASDENAMDMVVCGVEDQSVKDLLGMSKYAILETAAFIFEFSMIPFSGLEATDEAIHQYWTGERQRLVRFLACFPKVKQPIVLILWTEAREMWERVSPRMIEILNLDQMVGSPNGPLLSYNFLNLNISSTQLDPYIIGSLEWLASETKDFFEEPAVLLRGLLDKYRPIYEWALCRIALADGPFYSQFDEDDEEEAHRWLVRERERKKHLTNGSSSGGEVAVGGFGQEKQQSNPPRNLFVEATESGFNLAVSLFNLELESIAQTIEAKGQGETREGAEQEGKVKDAMARFIRQAELPPMKRGAIQERINFGMDPKSAFCDYMDVYIATLGGLAKEQQNLKAKSVMRTEIWETLTTSKEDRVPMEPAFKRISNQILQWVEAGILDTERFSIRINKLDQQRLDLRWQQGQYQAVKTDANDSDDFDEDPEQIVDSVPQLDVAFKPILIHDEVDVEGNVFDYEITVQSDVRAWEKEVETQARDREERALAVPGEVSSRSRLTLPNGLLRFGDSRKRRAPERPRDSMKKSRTNGDEADLIEEAYGEDQDDDNLYLTQPSSTPGTRASPSVSDDKLSQSILNLSRQSPLGSQSNTTSTLSPPVQHLHDLLQAYTNKNSEGGNGTQTVGVTTGASISASSFSWSTPNFLKGATTDITLGSQPRSTPVPISFTPTSSSLTTTTVPTVATSSISSSTSKTAGEDRLSRLRNLIKEVKTTTLQQ
ncbi:hypothetical protein BGZ49_005921 [Haplosporangium sp. Z 27]|nr:hypothetical protein BGZ49_005921 [Haplosporangium sp. Z 27]